MYDRSDDDACSDLTKRWASDPQPRCGQYCDDKGHTQREGAARRTRRSRVSTISH